MDVITDAMRSSVIKKKEKEKENLSRKLLEKKWEVCKPFPNHILEVFLFFFWFCECSNSICPTKASVLETWYDGGGRVKKNSTDVNEPTLHEGFFFFFFGREEEITSLIVLGLCPRSPDWFVNCVKSCADECTRAPFQTGCCKSPL